MKMKYGSRNAVRELVTRSKENHTRPRENGTTSTASRDRFQTTKVPAGGGGGLNRSLGVGQRELGGYGIQISHAIQTARYDYWNLPIVGTMSDIGTGI